MSGLWLVPRIFSLSLPTPPPRTRERAATRVRGSYTLAPAFGVTAWSSHPPIIVGPRGRVLDAGTVLLRPFSPHCVPLGANQSATIGSSWIFFFFCILILFISQGGHSSPVELGALAVFPFEFARVVVRIPGMQCALFIPLLQNKLWTSFRHICVIISSKTYVFVLLVQRRPHAFQRGCQSSSVHWTVQRHRSTDAPPVDSTTPAA